MAAKNSKCICSVLNKTKVFFAIAFNFIGLVCFAQGNSNDSAAISAPAANVYTIYMTGVAGASNLYNGPEYIGSYPDTKGTAFFLSDNFLSGSVCYYGINYHNVQMAYDLVGNVLVIKGYQNLNVALNSTSIDSFLLSNHLFIHINDTLNKESIPVDFYDVVYSKSLKVLVKRKKIIIHGSTPEEPYQFAQYNFYYLKKGNYYYGVVNKKSLLNILKDNSGQIKKYWRVNKLNFKKNPEHAIISIAEYYDQLKRQ